MQGILNLLLDKSGLVENVFHLGWEGGGGVDLLDSSRIVSVIKPLNVPPRTTPTDPLTTQPYPPLPKPDSLLHIRM